MNLKQKYPYNFDDSNSKILYTSFPKRNLQQGSMQIRVMENLQYRWLLFDDYLQTVMDKSLHYLPVLPHIHALLLSLYYQPLPQKVVELGLGGGTLARFFKHHFPDTAFISIENEPAVIDTYRHYFHPVSGHEIITQDAQTAVADLQDVDLLFVDLFSAHGSPDFVYQKDFYEQCLAALSAEGILIVNAVPTLQMQSEQVFELLLELEQRRPDMFSVPGFKNRVMLYPKQPASTSLDYNQHLLQLSQCFHIDLNCIVKLR